MYRLLCRSYQMMMKIAMYFLPWKMPETITGAGSVKEVTKIMEKEGLSKALIVTGPNIHKKGLLDEMLVSMEKAQLTYVIFDGVSANPNDLEVEEGRKLYLMHHCECIIAFGGGSPMDCAKAIGARVARPNKTVAQLQGLLKVLKPIPLLISIPTTAGTGSETTIAAVITDTKTHRKAALNDLRLIPAYAILDSQLTMALPPALTARTGMDALSHAVECYTNHTYNTKAEDHLCQMAVKLIHDYLYPVYLDGSYLEGRQQLQLAAFYAGRAFTRGCVGYVHAIGHTLGGLYGLSHGEAMGILLPHVMRAYGKKNYHRLAQLCDVCEIQTKENSDEAKAKAFIAWMEEMKVKMNIPTYPSQLQRKDFDQIIKWAMKEANPLYPTPVIWQKVDFYRFLMSMTSKNNS